MGKSDQGAQQPADARGTLETPPRTQAEAKLGIDSALEELAAKVQALTDKSLADSVAKLGSLDLLGEATRQELRAAAEVIGRTREASLAPPMVELGPNPDPTVVLLQRLVEGQRRAAEAEVRAANDLASMAQQTTLQAQLGVNQDRFTRRVSWAALVVALVSVVVGIVDVAVQVWATLYR